jgi:hypothetical protein
MKTAAIILNVFIGLLILWVIVIFLLIMPEPVNAQTKTNKPEKAKRKTAQMLYTKKDNNPERTAKLAKEVFALCPPLRPDRLHRRMKMFWGIDLNDYPTDGLIVLGGDKEAPKYYEGEGFGDETGSFVLSPQQGLIWMQTYQNSGMWGDLVPKSFPPEKYSLFYRYLMMSDTDALLKYYHLYENEMQKYGENEAFDSVNLDQTVDFMIPTYYNAIFDGRKATLEYIDKKKYDQLLLFEGTSDLRFDAFHLYFIKEREKGRKVYIEDREDMHYIPDYDNLIRLESIEYMGEGWIFDIYDESVDGLLAGRKAIASWFSAHLCYQIEGMNNSIVKCLYNNKGNRNPLKDTTLEKREKFKKSLKSNNYYGYTLLREFCENPMREMPSLEKIGKSFRANVKQPNTLLYLEHLADSYDIDTIQTVVFLKVYEMGHDAYYFIEVVKPVESPVAGPDGYAMILDRTETVYGYIRKDQIKLLTDSDILQLSTTTDLSKSKKGIISDPDGYVNIRQKMNIKSEIIGKIMNEEVFDYWDLPDGNWRVVQTENGFRGFVYKDRIR